MLCFVLNSFDMKFGLSGVFLFFRGRISEVLVVCSISVIWVFFFSGVVVILMVCWFRREDIAWIARARRPRSHPALSVSSIGFEFIIVWIII